MHRYGIITTLPVSKYASPTFTQRPICATSTYSTQTTILKPMTQSTPSQTRSNIFLSRVKLFCKLDCSQEYHCLQMAEQRSEALPAFNRRLAQGLSRALSALSSFIRATHQNDRSIVQVHSESWPRTYS